MSLLQVHFQSQYLNGQHQICVILPNIPRDVDPQEYYPANKKFKCLWLLHGTYGDHMDWLRHTMIETYAIENNIAVVCPNGLNTDFNNWPKFGLGHYMYDYLFKDLMPFIYNWFPISDKREDNFIAGLSMGGYGAMTYALGQPDKFAAAAALSAPLFDSSLSLKNQDGTTSVFSAFDKSKYPKEAEYLKPYRVHSRTENQIDNAGGVDEYLHSPVNAFNNFVKGKTNGVDLPKLYFCIGDDDFLYPGFKWLKNFVQEKNWSEGIEFEEEPGYKHEWRFWDMYIEKFIDKYIAKGAPKVNIL